MKTTRKSKPRKAVKSLVEAKLLMLKSRFLKENRDKREQQKKQREDKIRENAIINIKKLHPPNKAKRVTKKEGFYPATGIRPSKVRRTKLKRRKMLTCLAMAATRNAR